MTFYSWTISKPGWEDITKVTTLAELRDYLRLLDLPGKARPEFVTRDMETYGHGIYTHNEGSKDEWSLTWTRVDSEPANDL